MFFLYLSTLLSDWLIKLDYDWLTNVTTNVTIERCEINILDIDTEAI